jgi:hypothetical protein
MRSEECNGIFATPPFVAVDDTPRIVVEAEGMALTFLLARVELRLPNGDLGSTPSTPIA